MKRYRRRRSPVRKRSQIRRLLVPAVLACGAVILVRIGLKSYTSYRESRAVPISTEAGNGQAAGISSAEIKKRLTDMAGSDGRFAKILEHTDIYPKDLLYALTCNPSMLDFVREYPQKKGRVYADTIGQVKRGKIPLLIQWDKRWGYGAYGDSCVAVSGCAPCALSMVVAGLTNDNSVTPYAVAKFAQEHGYYVPGSGSSWTLISEGSSHFGITARELPLSETSIADALANGQPVICVVGPGDFTTIGHFIVLTGEKDGKIALNDPNSKERSARLWTYETLAPQIKNLWAMSR